MADNKGRQISVYFPADFLAAAQKVADQSFRGNLPEMVREAVALMIVSSGGPQFQAKIPKGRPPGT